MPKHVAIIGAGVGGLATAIDLAVTGHRVTVLERAEAVGGKVREVPVGGHLVDAGPSLLTMRWVLDELFARAGTSLDAHVTLRTVGTLGRHAWAGEQRLDLYADVERSADAIGQFAGAKDAAGFREYCRQARLMYQTLENRFIRRSLPQGFDLVMSAGPLGMRRLKPFTTLWDAVGSFMKDPRLLQLFSRASTDRGTSPFQAPAAAMLLWHVEQSGLFAVDGGMQRLVEAMAAVAAGLGVEIRTGAGVREVTVRDGTASGVRLEAGETIRADAVVMNGEPSALGAGLLGKGVIKAAAVTKFPQRTLSANSWAVLAETSGLPLLRRTVCFSRDTKLEFDLIGTGMLPTEPTITIIAPDRGDSEPGTVTGPERLLLAVNAPPSGDRRSFSQVEVEQCMHGMTGLMGRCGLELRLLAPPVMTSPAALHRMFPASGGAIYGPALTGATAAFKRPESRSRVKGLYLAGGSTHPGPGLPLAVLSGRLAAEAVGKDLAPGRSVFGRVFGK